MRYFKPNACIYINGLIHIVGITTVIGTAILMYKFLLYLWY
jgi:hypothetical protein